MARADLRMASFRIHPDKWADFIEYAREGNTTATSLILNYIDSCLTNSPNGVMTSCNRNDTVKNNDNTLECLKDVQDSLIEESQKHDRNINKLFELVEGLANKNKSLKSQINELEKTVFNDAKSYHDRQELTDSTVTENVRKLDQLDDLVATTRTQLNECKLELMTIEKLKVLLKNNNIDFSNKMRKIDLLELALENELILI